MKRTLTLLVFILISYTSEAQFIKQKSINAQIGLGISSPYESEDEIAGSGFFLQGELVLRTSSWLELKPYAGLFLTNSDDEDLDGNPTNERVESKAFLIGGKVRVRAPLPWVAPYIELGIGASIGKFETFTAFTNIKKSGFIYHIPFAFGLELGRKNNFDLGFAFYAQPTVEQSIGGFAFGFSFPIN